MSARDPVAILKAIETACQQCSSELQEQPEKADVWAGIAFRTGGNLLVAALGEVLEVIDYPEMTRVPRTQPWLLGVANVRGSLLPVVDLQLCLQGEGPPVSQKSRVLVISRNDIYSGLAVDEVLGIRYFTESDLVESGIEINSSLQPYVSHGYSRDGQYWGVFSMCALADSAEFLRAAV